MPCLACGKNCSRGGYPEPCGVPDGEYGYYLDNKLVRCREPSLSVAVVRSRLPAEKCNYDICPDYPGQPLRPLLDVEAVDCTRFTRLCVVPQCHP